MPATPIPPKHLAPATRRWWRSVVESYVLEEHHVRLLTLAAECWDRTQQARAALATVGSLTFDDRHGRPVLRPEVGVERDSRLAFARLLRELDLDVEGPPAASRPPTLRRHS